MTSNRSFGLLFTVFFVIVGIWPVFSGGAWRTWALFASGAVLFVAIFAPKVLSVPNRLWMQFGDRLHRITSTLILGVLFFGVITPFGAVMRFFGRDALRLRRDESVDSYWIHRDPPGPDPKAMKNQF